MCYNAAALTQASLKYAKHRGENPEEIAALEQKLEQERQLLNSYHYVNAFEHPRLLVFTQEEPLKPQFFRWGLIPSWCKDESVADQLSNQTLNARSETIFEKPAFRSSAKNKRCLIYLDAFYEYHHLKSKTYPFHISMKDGTPMILGGLYDNWVNPTTGELIQTVTIVTTEGNEVMAKIHNNPKATGPRMPLIFSKEMQNEWLRENATKEEIETLIKPFSSTLLSFHPVAPLKGKLAIGNKPEAQNPVEYPELTELLK